MDKLCLTLSGFSANEEATLILGFSLSKYLKYKPTRPPKKKETKRTANTFMLELIVFYSVISYVNAPMI